MCIRDRMQTVVEISLECTTTPRKEVVFGMLSFCLLYTSDTSTMISKRPLILVSNDDGVFAKGLEEDRKSTRLNSSHVKRSRMPSSA